MIPHFARLKYLANQGKVMVFTIPWGCSAPKWLVSLMVIAKGDHLQLDVVMNHEFIAIFTINPFVIIVFYNHHPTISHIQYI